MNKLTEKEIQEYMEEFDAMTDSRVLSQLSSIHNVLDTDDMHESILIDTALDLEYLLLWECAIRLSYRVQKEERADMREYMQSGRRG